MNEFQRQTYIKHFKILKLISETVARKTGGYKNGNTSKCKTYRTHTGS